MRVASTAHSHLPTKRRSLWVDHTKEQALVPPVVLARIAGGFLLRQPTLFGRLRVGHVLAIHTQHTAAVDGALEPAQRAVDVFLVADFNANSYVMGQG